MLKTERKLSALKVLIINLCLMTCSIDCDVTKKHEPTFEKHKSDNYEEYHMEHQVTKQEAIVTLQSINKTFFDAPLPPGCKAIHCDQNVMKYCLGPQFLNDHCLCEQGHTREGLPWVPHTCYVGDKEVTASVGSCFFYNDVKECCCDRSIAKRWKFLSASNQIKGSCFNILTSILTLIVIRARIILFLR